MTIVNGVSRVTNLLQSNVILASIRRSSNDLFALQVQMSTGKRVNRPSDDPGAAATVGTIRDEMERRDQRLRNLSHAESVLNTVDASLGDVTDLLIEAKGIGLSQIGVSSDAATRANQATVIDSILTEVTNIANREYLDLHLFSGSSVSVQPFTGLLNGLEYHGQGDGLVTDLGLSSDVTLTLSGEDAFGAMSERVEGERDFDPIMNGSTRLADLNGARDLGISLGTVTVTQGGTSIEVDLSGAHTVDDVVTTLETEIQAGLDATAVVQLDAVTENRLEIIPTLGSGAITVTDPSTDGPAADLGLAAVTFPDDGVGATGGDLDPRITPQTALADLSGLTVPLGTVRFENLGQIRDLDLSSATTVEDLTNAVDGLKLGIRVVIGDDGDRLDVVNTVSGGSMSIGEVGGGTTATELGIRSLAGRTELDVFNDDAGVSIVSGAVDPITGLPDPTRDVDFRITLKDAVELDIDLAGATTVQDVLDTINAVATTAGYTIGTDFEAKLVDDGNGIEIVDNTNGGVGTTAVERLNNSTAAEDLGILGSTTSASLTGTDRAKVAVESLFTHLIALRDALLADDERGITLATGKFESDINRATESRATVGVRSRRVADAQIRAEDLQVQDRALMSELEDLDFTDAAIRFSLLQTQLQAGLATAGQTTQLSLLDFIG